jgi:hypothetical protein
MLCFMASLISSSSPQLQNSAPAPKQLSSEKDENILACLGLPVKGQPCGLNLEAFVSREAIDAVILKGVRELPPRPGIS